MGSVIGLGYPCPLFKIKETVDTPNILKVCVPLPMFNLQAVQIAVTNQGNSLFYCSDSSIYNAKFDKLSPGKRNFGPNNIRDGQTSILLQFPNRQFIALSIDDSQYQTKLTKIDATDHEQIQIVSSSFPLMEDSVVSGLSAARLNDSSYLYAEYRFPNKIVLYKISWNNIVKLSEFTIGNGLKLFNPSEYSSPSRVSISEIEGIRLSNHGNKIAIILREYVKDRVKIGANYYQFKTILTGRRINLYDINPADFTIGIANELITSTPAVTDRTSYFSELTFSPNDSFLYVMQHAFPSNNSKGIYQYPVYPNAMTNLSIPMYELPYAAPYSNRYNFYSMLLTHWGSILFTEVRDTISYFQYLKNSEKIFSKGDLFESKPMSKYFYALIAATKNIYNYVEIEPKNINNCNSNFKFLNSSNQGRGFTEFVWYFAQDTNGTVWDTVKGVEPEYHYTSVGKYAYKCRGFSSKDNYSELFEDSVWVTNVPPPALFQTDTPTVIYSTVDNNKLTQVKWRSLRNAYKYRIYKDDSYIGETLDTVYFDNLQFEMVGPISYKIEGVDYCGNASAKSRIARTIFLKASVIKPFSKNEAEAVMVQWTPYIYWPNGVDRYEVSSTYQITLSNWTTDAITQDTIEKDLKFIREDEAEKCYKITAFNSLVISQSNTICLPIEPAIFIPNAFTANNDQLNDQFQIIQRGFGKLSMTIYSAWGQKIYETSDTKLMWDPGNSIPTGVYTYVIRATSVNQTEYRFIGTVHLIR